MIGLDRLMKQPGVIAAGQFTSDGQVERSVGALSADELEKVARACVAADAQARATAQALDEASPLDWGSLNGWVLWGAKHALCVSGNTGVIVEATKADFNQLLVDLFGPPAAGMPIQ